MTPEAGVNLLARMVEYGGREGKKEFFTVIR